MTNYKEILKLFGLGTSSRKTPLSCRRLSGFRLSYTFYAKILTHLKAAGAEPLNSPAMALRVLSIN